MNTRSNNATAAHKQVVVNDHELIDVVDMTKSAQDLSIAIQLLNGVTQCHPDQKLRSIHAVLNHLSAELQGIYGDLDSLRNRLGAA